VDQAATQAWQAGVRAAKWEALAGNTAGLAIQVSFIVVLGLGGARVASGAIDVGTLIAFLLYLYYLLPPMQGLVGAASQYQVGAAAVARIRQAEQLPAAAPGRRPPRHWPAAEERPGPGGAAPPGADPDRRGREPDARPRLRGPAPWQRPPVGGAIAIEDPTAPSTFA
jgi:ABC-type multidrug transport system fused ATPase/permease subunit